MASNCWASGIRGRIRNEGASLVLPARNVQGREQQVPAAPEAPEAKPPPGPQVFARVLLADALSEKTTPSCPLTARRPT